MLPPTSYQPPLPPLLPPFSPSPYLEVDWVHTQLVGVQVTQSRQGTGQVIQVSNCGGQGISDFLAVGLDLGRAVAHIKVREVGLGGGVYNEHPVGRRWGEELRSQESTVKGCPLCTLSALDSMALTEQRSHLSRASAPYSPAWPPILPQAFLMLVLSSPESTMVIPS